MSQQSQTQQTQTQFIEKPTKGDESQFSRTGDWNSYFLEFEGTKALLFELEHFWPVDFKKVYTKSVFSEENMKFKYQEMRVAFQECFYNKDEEVEFFVNEKTNAVVYRTDYADEIADGKFALMLHLRYEEGNIITTL